MKNRLLAVVIGACLGSVSFGQESSPSQKPSDGDVVRITTNLVQVDAVITDKNGKPITDLKPDELQLSEDNRARKITHFSYIAGDTSTSKPVVRDNRVHGVPPDQLRPEDVRRTIALVVDDLGLSFPSTHFVRHALKQFIDQQMQTGDLVAKRIIDEKGYYLIGYRPDQTTFDPRTGRRTFHHLSLKVLRAGKWHSSRMQSSRSFCFL
jgi:hypothetical protein